MSQGETHDRWETRADGGVVRVRNVPRTALFLPRGFADIPRPLFELSDRRETTIVPTDGGEVETMEDKWRDPLQAALNLGKQRFGHTTFYPKEGVGCGEVLEVNQGGPVQAVEAHLTLRRLMTHRPKLPGCPFLPEG